MMLVDSFSAEFVARDVIVFGKEVDTLLARDVKQFFDDTRNVIRTGLDTT